jgi:hypothetical protein
MRQFTNFRFFRIYFFFFFENDKLSGDLNAVLHDIIQLLSDNKLCRVGGLWW